jgi:hypothetical protein
MRFAILPYVALLAGAAHAKASSPKRFFVSRLESAWRLKIIFRAAEAVCDHGSGRVDTYGTTSLIRWSNDPASPRAAASGALARSRRAVWRVR